MPVKTVVCAVCGQTVSHRQTLHLGDGKRACRSHSETQAAAADMRAGEHFAKEKEKEKWQKPTWRMDEWKKDPRFESVALTLRVGGENIIVDENGQRYAKLGNISWFTNLDIPRLHKPLTLWKEYSPEEYPKYDNYDAINVDKVAEIPCDYFGEMGVPITFMGSYCPEQFEIVGNFNGTCLKTKLEDGFVLSKDTAVISGGKESVWNGPVVGKKALYKRIVIRRRLPTPTSLD